MIAFYYQTNTPIGFWCKQWLNSRFLIQPSKTLPVELIEIHNVKLKSKCQKMWCVNRKSKEKKVTVCEEEIQRISYLFKH